MYDRPCSVGFILLCRGDTLSKVYVSESRLSLCVTLEVIYFHWNSSKGTSTQSQNEYSFFFFFFSSLLSKVVVVPILIESIQHGGSKSKEIGQKTGGRWRSEPLSSPKTSCPCYQASNIRSIVSFWLISRLITNVSLTIWTSKDETFIKILIFI